MLSEEDSEISDSSKSQESKANSLELSGSFHDQIEEEKHEQSESSSSEDNKLQAKKYLQLGKSP